MCADQQQGKYEGKGTGRNTRARVTVVIITAGVLHGEPGSSKHMGVDLAAVCLPHAAPGDERAVVAITPVSGEAQLGRRTLRQDELHTFVPGSDVAVVAQQVGTRHGGHHQAEEQEHTPRPVPLWPGGGGGGGGGHLEVDLKYANPKLGFQV